MALARFQLLTQESEATSSGEAEWPFVARTAWQPGGRSDDGGAVANQGSSRSLLWPAILVGIGVAGSLDEILLHQLLRWHHFYDRGA